EPAVVANPLQQEDQLTAFANGDDQTVWLKQALFKPVIFQPGISLTNFIRNSDEQMVFGAERIFETSTIPSRKLNEVLWVAFRSALRHRAGKHGRFFVVEKS